MSAFNVNSRYVLLTYAQCGDLDPWAVNDLLSTLGAECIIGRERHEDGGIHLHAFVDFNRKFRTRRSDIFDVDGHHPNISQSRGTPEAGYDYAIKDGDVVAGGLGRPEGKSRGGDGSTHAKWTAITQAENREQFWELCHELDPKAAATSFTQLSKYADWRFAPDPPVYEHPIGISFTDGDFDGRREWLDQAGIGGGERRGKWSYTSAYLLRGGDPLKGNPYPPLRRARCAVRSLIGGLRRLNLC